MKLFQTSSIEVVRECEDIFNCKLPSVILRDRYDRFFVNAVEYSLVKLFFVLVLLCCFYHCW